MLARSHRAQTTISSMNARALATLFLPLVCTNLVAQQKVVRLYEGRAPGSENWKLDETGPPRRSQPNCTFIKRADTASECESKTFPPTTGWSVSPIGWRFRGC